MAARRRNAKKAAPAKGGGKKAPKAKKAKKVKEAKEVSPGPPMEVVLSIVTAVMLLAAVIMIDHSSGTNYGMGALFSGNYGK
ncbi:MAG: hypothetical protein QM477_00765 [Planctomycetota bacterium]